MITTCRFICILLLCCLFSINLHAQDTEERNLDSFSEISVTDRIIVRLIKADKESATIKTDGIEPSSVQTEIEDNILTIRIYGRPFARKKAIVTLYYVDIRSIIVSGGADVSTVSVFHSDSLAVNLSSGGMLYLNADLNYINGKIAGGSILNAEGYVKSQDMTISTSATLSAFSLKVDSIDIIATSGGKAKINIEKVLKAEASSKAYISYKGNPEEIHRNESSGGVITPYTP